VTVKFGILGVLVVRNGTSDASVPAAKQRVVLAHLLLRANKVVSTDALIEAVWGEHPPPRARITVQNYVMRLRRLLGPIAGERIITRAPGYLIEVHDGELDLDRFTALRRRGIDASAAGDWKQAAYDFREALELWRGDSLADVTSATLHADDGARLDDLRLQVLESRIGADVQLGHHDQVIVELRSLIARHPLREGFCAQLMNALWRTGRRAEALEAFRDLRRRLVDELGVEPCEEVQHLHQKVLAGATPSMTVDSPPTTTTVPAQLPADLPDFTGRRAQVEQLRGMLADTAAKNGDLGAVVVSAVAGAGGIGKTTIAIHAAHLVRDRYPDGQLYVNLRGASEQQPAPAETLSRLLRDLGVDGAAIPSGEEELSARYRSLLAGRRMLIVLDDARDAAQVRPLLPGTAGIGVLVTSRSSLPGLPGGRVIDLDVLDAKDAAALFAAIVGAERAGNEPEATRDVLAACGGMPLAVRIASSRLAARPGWSIRFLADRLADERTRLNELATGDLAVRAGFQVSYDNLPVIAGPVDAARVFRFLGLAPGPTMSLPAVARLLGTDEDSAYQALEPLVDAHLLESPTAGRYRFHDLLRVYARERVIEEEAQSDRDDAVRRLLTWYLHTAVAATRVLAPQIRRISLDGESVPLSFGSYGDALRWCEAERANLVAASRQAHEQGMHELAWKLPAALVGFFRLRRHGADWLATHHTGMASARILGDRHAEGWMLNGLGGAYLEVRGPDVSIAYRKQALKIYRELGDRREEARSFNNLGAVHGELGRYDEAIDYLQRALAIQREIGDRKNSGITLGNLGEALQLLNRPDEAIDYLRQALVINEESENHFHTASTLNILGDLHRDLRLLDEAIDFHQRALAIRRELSDRHGQAKVLNSLCRALDELGRIDEARAARGQLIALYKELGDPRGAD
jgi:DNA-binding SARP family transcriptional activator